MTRGLPRTIRTDNGKEFCGRAMLTWAHLHTVNLRLIEPGKPNQNAYVESLGGLTPAAYARQLANKSVTVTTGL